MLLKARDDRSLLERKILFFGGKGGVGKTTVASAYALLSADRGHKTLLVSTDPAHSTSDILEVNLGPEPKQVMDNFWAMEIDPAREADRYIQDVKDRIAESIAPRLVQEVERQIDIARVSPGAQEAALFDRFTSIIREIEHGYDRILFDTAPTGQTLRLLSLPEQMTAWMSGLISRRQKVNILGRMWRNVAGAAAGDEVKHEDRVLVALQERKKRFAHARAVITDKATSTFVFVVVPERLPILETQKAVEALDRYAIPVGAVFVNRVLPSDAEGEFLQKRREREAGYLERIADAFTAHPVYHLPLFDSDVLGVEALRRVIAELPEREQVGA